MEEGGGDLDVLQAKLGVRWDAIRRAREEAARVRAVLDEGLARYTTEDTSLVVFGSVARGEATSASDVDWTLLVDGQMYPEQADAVGEIADWVAERFRGPGREGTFGGLASSPELIHRIGGEEDTNRNLTQRILLLLESVPIGRPDAHARVVRGLLERYIHEDLGWRPGASPARIPRFLQNDIARYWRTVAVDFAYKRHRRTGEGWALRTAKLRMSRKLTYAAGLAACFRCAFLDVQAEGVPADARAQAVVDELERFLARTPLERMASVFLRFEALSPAAERFFGSYDRFLALLDDDARRRALESLGQVDAAEDETFQYVRALGRDFQEALNELFLPNDRGAFHDLTRTYGVF
jgi:predicted nucleotidyltransferase